MRGHGLIVCKKKRKKKKLPFVLLISLQSGYRSDNHLGHNATQRNTMAQSALPAAHLNQFVGQA